MTLIKSISGIRGTIGGRAGEGLTPSDVVNLTSAFAAFIRETSPVKANNIVVGRDARISGPMIRDLVCGALTGMGFNVTDIGLATTPTTEIAVSLSHADGGIIITASHNPMHWNALKLLNHKGEFLNKAEGDRVLQLAADSAFAYAEVERLGAVRHDDSFNQKHIDLVWGLAATDVYAIASAHFRVALDTVNSVGGIILPQLLLELGVADIVTLNSDPTGVFAHNPEPLERNLGGMKELMQKESFDVGFVVDPDVDRLAVFCNDGAMMSEEYTLVCAADYVLRRTPGNTVSNLSSTRALRDVTAGRGKYAASAVGEVNVVEKMKETNAVIGGEGNGGVIYPEAHYGRDALVGIALILSNLATSGKTMAQLRDSYPKYFMCKQRIELSPSVNVDETLRRVQKLFPDAEINTADGVKFDFPDCWVHLRKSNTEPILRVYAEAHTKEKADGAAQAVMDAVRRLSAVGG